MSCHICYILSFDYGNSILCSCCGKIVCGNCAIDLFLFSPELKCPTCRTLYSLDDESMISGLEKICERSNDTEDAKICLSILYFKVGKPYQSRQILEQMGDKIYNFKGGCYYLAHFNRYGIGGKKDSQKAFKLFLKVAEVGFSIFYLGEMFENGEGIPMNKSYGKILKKITFNSTLFPIHHKTGKVVYF